MRISDNDVLTIRELREAEYQAYLRFTHYSNRFEKNWNGLNTESYLFFKWRDAVAELDLAVARLDVGKTLSKPSNTSQIT